MNYLRELLEKKDNKFILNLATAFAVGILILLASNTFFKPKPTLITPESVEVNTEEIVADEDYAMNLERRLEDALASVEGVGKVKVMLTLSNGKEILLAENSNYTQSEIRETDAQGGTRASNELNTTGTKIMLKTNDGSDKPLILKEIEPKVEGVIIVAEGGGNMEVQSALIKAAQAVLGIETHKIQVLKFKK